MEDLKCNCPNCGKRINVELYRVAVMQFKRKCRNCGDRWQILAKPLQNKGCLVHVLSFVKI